MAKQKSNETIEREKLIEEIINFVKKTSGRSSLSNSESIQMFGLYNRYYGTAEDNYSCYLCAIRIFDRLKNIKS